MIKKDTKSLLEEQTKFISSLPKKDKINFVKKSNDDDLISDLTRFDSELHVIIKKRKEIKEMKNKGYVPFYIENYNYGIELVENLDKIFVNIPPVKTFSKQNPIILYRGVSDFKYLDLEGFSSSSLSIKYALPYTDGIRPAIMRITIHNGSKVAPIYEYFSEYGAEEEEEVILDRHNVYLLEKYQIHNYDGIPLIDIDYYPWDPSLVKRFEESKNRLKKLVEYLSLFSFQLN